VTALTLALVLLLAGCTTLPGEAWAGVLERGYDGMMIGKDEASPYREGRTLAWLKVKVPRYREGERGWEPKT
jgi:hypothetical protein